MHRKIRNGIFLLFLGFFVVGTPCVVLYTAGYRLNMNTWRVQRTGVIAITTLPRGAKASIQNVQVAEKTPYVAQRLTPGEYTVLLEKEGYQPWNQHVTVNSGSTTYITALLFAQTAPELLLEETALSVTGDRSGRFIYLLVPSASAHHIWRYDTVTRLQRKLSDDVGTAITHIALNNDESVLLLSADDSTTVTAAIPVDGGILLDEEAAAKAIAMLPEYAFVNNGSNVELRLFSTNTLITLLPLSTYTPMFRNTDLALFTDTRNRAYALNLRTQTVTHIDIPTTLLATGTDETLLAASDGNEIDIYTPSTGERTLITRQSEPIIALAWHTSNHALFFATPSSITAIEREKYTTRNTTTLLENASITAIWPDANGKHLTFFGTVDGITGIWRIILG